VSQEPAPARPFGARFFAVHVMGSLLVGGGIYLAFRTEGLLMFDWAHAVGLLPGLSALRSYTLPYAQNLPEWLLYSVPDGAWVYSSTAFFGRMWRGGPRLPRLAWTWWAAVVAIGSELAQHPWFEWVPGTFDAVDVLCYAVAGAAASWAVRRASLEDARVEPG
jgi:hypothetical protein